MPTGQLIESPSTLPGGPIEAVPERSAPPSLAPRLLAVALLLVILYAAFDHGAVAPPVRARVEVAVAVIALVAAVAWLAAGTLRLALSRTALAGTLLLVLFACWSGVTVLWSVAPDQTWVELNRALAYVVVLCLGIAVGASYDRAVSLIAKGFLAIVLAVTAYALGQKLFPGVRVGGLFSLNQTATVPRLQEPLGYWNALALFVAMGAPLALAGAANTTSTRRARLAAAWALQLILITVGLTTSRGGLIALAVALVVGIAAGGERLRQLEWLVAAVVAAVPPVAFGLASHALTTPGVALSSREGAGAILAAILLACSVGLVAVGRALLGGEPRLAPLAARVGAARRPALGIVAVLVVSGLVALGVTGVFTHAWHSFTSTQQVSNYSPNRLLTAESNRWVWWKEAANAFADRPAGGWGAGSFGVVHLLYRHNTLPVQQPHSVPLQFLAETGVVGALLALGAFALLLRSAAAAIRRFAPGPERMLAGGLLGAAFAYAVHSLYDWDWNIPAVSLPALVFVGVLVASHRERAPRIDVPGPRAATLAVLTVWLCAFAVSSVLPSLAASEASSALVEASSAAPGALTSAQSTAALASKLDPLSDAGLRVEATVAVHRGNLARARAYLRQAVGRDPSDRLAWAELAQVDRFLGDLSEAALAQRRLVALDPEGQASKTPPGAK